VLSKVRGDVNPADVLTKPKSLEDMKVLLNFSCLDWCDGKVGENTCRDNRIEFVNSIGNSSFEDTGNVGRYYFVNSPTVRRRGALEFEQFVSDPTPQTQTFVDANMGPVGDMLATLSQVGFRVGRIDEQTCKCMFGSRCM